jgi:hypothetical protein
MDIESRLGKLEDFAVETRERLTRIETRLEQTATKADLAEVKAAMIKWIAGAALGMSLAGIMSVAFVIRSWQHAPIPQEVPCKSPTPNNP